MFTNIEVEHFQGFKLTQNIDLAPITLIFGANSAGKSSIFRLFSLLKQSTENAHTGMSPSYMGKDIDLVSFSNVVTSHDINTEITVKTTFNIAANLGIRMSMVIDKFGVQRFGYGLIKAGQHEVGAGGFEISFERSGEVNAFQCVAIAGNKASFSAAFPEVPWEQIDLQKFKKAFTNKSNIWFLNTHFYPENRELYTRKPNLESVIARIITARLGSMYASKVRNSDFIGPLRMIPGRVVSTVQSGAPDVTDSRGLLGYLRGSDFAIEGASKWIDKITEGAFSLKLVSFNQPEFSFLGDFSALLLIDKRTNEGASLSDVGVGISQVLPIIVKLISMSQSEINGEDTGDSLDKAEPSDNLPTIFIEQPELHLHPRAQAELADLFVEYAKPSSGQPPIQIVAETHSESLIIRLQRRLREGTISPGDISVLYVEKTDQGSNVISLPVNANGTFLVDWPMDFADSRLRDY